MFADRTFRIALSVSLILHAAMFFKFPRLNFLSVRRPADHVEVTYIKEKLSPLNLESFSKKLPKETSRQTFSKKIEPPPYVEKERLFREAQNIAIKKPDFVRPEIIAMKKKITLPPLNDEKINSPVYLNYYQIIREKIKQAAYRNYNRLVNGEVYLSFIVLRNGQLKELKINEERIPAHPYLKGVAEESILDASPFPEFPKDLDYPELSFNVIISFLVE